MMVSLSAILRGSTTSRNAQGRKRERPGHGVSNPSAVSVESDCISVHGNPSGRISDRQIERKESGEEAPARGVQCANCPEAELSAFVTGTSGHIPAYESSASLWSKIATFRALGVAWGQFLRAPGQS